MTHDPPIIPPHRLKVVLMRPQIAPNTGNVARLCVATGTPLHIVRPMGFVLSDREIKRSAMDYWPRLMLTVHDDEPSLWNEIAGGGGNPWLFTTKATRSFWDVTFAPDDWLIFGNESAGLPDATLQAHSDQCIRIPQVAGERCLNLATAVGIGLYETIRKLAILA